MHQKLAIGSADHIHLFEANPLLVAVVCARPICPSINCYYGKVKTFCDLRCKKHFTTTEALIIYAQSYLDLFGTDSHNHQLKVKHTSNVSRKSA